MVVDQNSWNNAPLWLVDYKEFYAFHKHKMNAFWRNTFAFICLILIHEMFVVLVLNIYLGNHI
jgi:hypothetical protein